MSRDGGIRTRDLVSPRHALSTRLSYVPLLVAGGLLREARRVLAAPVAVSGSGRRDSNPRPPAPKAGALTRLSYAPERTT